MSHLGPNRYRPAGRRSQQRARLHLFVTIFAMMALVSTWLSQTMQVAASAPGDETPTEQVEQPTEPPPIEPTDEPAPPTEEAVPTDPQVTATVPETPPETTETPAPTVANELIGTINVYYAECPAGVDVTSATSDDLTNTCVTQRNGVQFQISASGTVIGTQATGYFGDSFVGFDQVPTGSVTVKQSTAPAALAVYCNGIVSHGGPETGLQRMPVSGSAITWNLLDDEIAYCSWFVGAETGAPTAGSTVSSSPTASPSTQGEQLGNINVEYWQCAAGFDPSAASPTDLETNCTAQPNGIVFKISNASGPIATETTGDDADGAVDFSEVPTGLTTISQVPAPGSAAVICHGIVSNGGPETGDMRLPVANGAVTWNLIDEEIAFCNWYAGGVTGTPSSLASIAIHAFTCPAGYDWSTNAVSPRNACVMPMDRVSFDMTDSLPNSAGWMFETGGDGTGVDLIEGLQPGSYTFKSSPRADTSQAFLWDCYPADGTSSRTSPLAEGLDFSFNLPANVKIRCDAFLVPLPSETGSLVVQYWTCPATFDVTTATSDIAQTTCTTSPADIQFQTQNVDGMSDARTTAASPGGVIFDPVAAGSITVVQTPAPASDGMAFCQTFAPGLTSIPPVENVAIQNGAINRTIVAGGILECKWYVADPNSGFGTVYINKHACPTGFEAYNATIYQMAANCHDNAGAVDFSLHYPDGVTAQGGTTTGSGINDVRWTTVPAGKSSIWEDNPAGYGSPVVFCKVELEDGTDVLPYAEIPTIDGRAIEWNLAGGQLLSCDWYNVPSGTGTVHILKHACAAGYDITGKTIYNFAADCHENAGAVEFKVNASGTIYTGTTTNSGINDVNFPGLPAGTISVTETLAAGTGLGMPVVFCKVDLENGTDVVPFARIPVVNASTIDWQLGTGHVLWCDWYNVPQPTHVSVTIYKFGCGGSPNTYMTGGLPDYQKFNSLCTNPLPGVVFAATNAGGTVATGTTTNSNPLTLANIPVGTVSISEALPTGYGMPYIFCGPDYANGLQVATDATITLSLTGPSGIICNWYNVPTTPGSLKIYKWTCPQAYDYTKPGANPVVDCTEPTNGINFTVTDSNPATVDLQTMTGDSIQGAVTWGGLPNGDYTVSETVPDGIAQVFVLDCTGSLVPAIHPTPLWVGNPFRISVGSGDAIVCNWYNVPKKSADTGDLTIHAYICTTSTYVSDVQCETYEQGRKFSIQPGALSGTTNQYGVLALQGLNAGNYTIAEADDGQPCRMVATQLDGNNTAVNVLDSSGSVKVTGGRETVVGVYNCTAKPSGGGKLPTSGKLPTKFPNTGMQDTQVIQPETAPDVAGTPVGESCLPAGTPTASTPESGISCGSVPVSIRIDAITVDATVEVLETVNGEMQQPTGPSDVAWYKETPKLGAPGNIVMAGHLNYWGVPEGVFFNLATLRSGDRIELTGDSGKVFVYQVESVSQADATLPPAEGVLGVTTEPSLTLITCGGPWNAETSLYTERTVVRAVLVQP